MTPSTEARWIPSKVEHLAGCTHRYRHELCSFVRVGAAVWPLKVRKSLHLSCSSAPAATIHAIDGTSLREGRRPGGDLPHSLPSPEHHRGSLCRQGAQRHQVHSGTYAFTVSAELKAMTCGLSLADSFLCPAGLNTRAHALLLVGRWTCVSDEATCHAWEAQREQRKPHRAGQAD